ncbi:glycerophosphodiester phosphodiesterase [Alteromonas halophila]|uniref:glycerophosphodiester phosphodiesterase n=1 Tax=Alteromonas halophila TaxID=516698 RepID=A0A918JG35_9ALTE|nr:glycerophosphodiester phosphodiesterase [Alteromonas halophila]GGW74298.1 glycerophosphodiester phosphodiesterase [Alteromonas halophila]
MHRYYRALIRAVFFVSALLIVSSPSQAFDIIAHRGASGYLPEHTLAAATLAHAQAPDYIEQDVVLSRDHIPIVLHDIHLETVTNVESVFPERARKDGRFYAIDFTLAELKTLRIHERHNAEGKAVFPSRFGSERTDFRIATLREHIELIVELNRLTHSTVGFYTEIKSPSWHKRQGADISNIVLNTLADYGLTANDANLILQCFDLKEIKRIRDELNYTGKLIMLIGDNSWQESDTDYQALRTVRGIDTLTPYVDGIGPWITHLVSASQDIPDWLQRAKTKGLIVHPYTFRTDALPGKMTSIQLLSLLKEQLAVDGVFTDQVPAVKAYLHGRD